MLALEKVMCVVCLLWRKFRVCCMFALEKVVCCMFALEKVMLLYVSSGEKFW